MEIDVVFHEVGGQILQRNFDIVAFVNDDHRTGNIDDYRFPDRRCKL